MAHEKIIEMNISIFTAVQGENAFDLVFWSWHYTNSEHAEFNKRIIHKVFLIINKCIP